jgi:hypothetical protein
MRNRAPRRHPGFSAPTEGADGAPTVAPPFPSLPPLRRIPDATRWVELLCVGGARKTRGWARSRRPRLPPAPAGRCSSTAFDVEWGAKGSHRWCRFSISATGASTLYMASGREYRAAASSPRANWISCSLRIEAATPSSPASWSLAQHRSGRGLHLQMPLLCWSW